MKRTAGNAGAPMSTKIQKRSEEPTMGKLHFKDGLVIEGKSFGAEKSMAGEIVFNTGMVGYPEALTDPSYRGQILVLTYPLVGNYGVPSEDTLDKFGLPQFFESNDIHIAGLIVAEYSAHHSHWNAETSLGEWLKSRGIPALHGVDTRMLTKKIREHGCMLGKIEFADMAVEFADPNQRNLVAEVSTKEVKVYNEGMSPKIAVFDCGIKYNIIRYLASFNVELTVLPFDYNLKDSKLEWDGLFISNGPGDPTMAAATIEQLKWATTLTKPIFGICLGNQLLALATGAKTYKMKYGNRGMNQPCIDLRTSKCYITPQNHGFAVDSDSLASDWKPFFINANDKSNEGIIHTSKPFFSVQFHPEANGGPMDTAFLFKMFMDHVNGQRPELTLLEPNMFDRPTVKKIVLLGSGGLSIGQAGEFDYSGSQAIKALKEEGIKVVLINPNIATVQTSKGLADKVYFLPVTFEVVMDVIKKEEPDGIVLSMGGQSALNVGIELFNSGELEKHGVRVLGTPVPTIIDTEDREKFGNMMVEIGETVAKSFPATSIAEAVEAANKIGYPVLVRAAFALGGMGSGFAENDDELKRLAKIAFATSNQILIDMDLRGWKEVEYEVVRDCRDNCITVCNMENFDPLGVHTGDSIVVAPSQTLSNSEYFRLRATAQKVVRHLGIVGECNIQYALDPHSERFTIIEVNARLSRSSALASKATGYPLAYVAAKLALNIDLVSIRNSVTKTTTACFEPSLDYCVVKVPRWDLGKFNQVSRQLGSSMLSVGEVMSIGRTFEEAIQKAIRMVNPNLEGITGRLGDVYEPGKAPKNMDKDLDEKLKKPADTRLFSVMDAFYHGYSVEQIHQLTRIDRWFLHKLDNIMTLRTQMHQYKHQLETIPRSVMMDLKVYGFSDRQIARSVMGSERNLQTAEMQVRRKRRDFKITPCVKQIDTLAAEYPAMTNYLYMTYSGEEDDVQFSQERDNIIVLGCGAYCIGSSVEFDWCAVSAVRAIQDAGMKAIVVNYNPETVSTDYDESDRLYFEELSLERVLDIYEKECPHGLVLSVGGQIPNNLAVPLGQQGVNVLGTSPEMIDTAEDRTKFSSLLDSIGVDQPMWSQLTTVPAALEFAQTAGYPVLVRPSYVLSGAAMAVAFSEDDLRDYLNTAINAESITEVPIIAVSKFIQNAKEIEFDGVAKDGFILNYAMSEHVENAGVHSGDATLVLPARKLYLQTIFEVKRIAAAIAHALKITGPFNIQLMARDNDVKVIECNLRASRTFPFISKTFDFNFISLATKAMLGLNVKPHPIALADLDYVGVKAPMFSFSRLRGCDPTTGVEMASTGEVACYGNDVHEAYLKALISTGFKMPTKLKKVLLSVGGQAFKLELVQSAEMLVSMGYQIFATKGTHEFLELNNIQSTFTQKISEEEATSKAAAVASKKRGKEKKATKDTIDEDAVFDTRTLISENMVDLVINITSTRRGDSSTSDGYAIRRDAVDFGVPLVTDTKCAALLIHALQRLQDGKVELAVMHIGEYYKMPVLGWTTGTGESFSRGSNAFVKRVRHTSKDSGSGADSPRKRKMSLL